MDIFGTLIARPFGWVFWAILQIINNYGVALILFSLIVKIILYPLQYKGKKGMLAQQRLQPKIKDIEARYKNDRTAYNAALQELYTQNGISPMSGCLPMLLTFPIMIGLYRVIRQPLSYVFGVSSDGVKELISSLTSRSAEAATALAGMADGSAAVNEITVMKYLVPTDQYFIDMNFLGLDLTQTPSFKELSWLMILPILSGATALLMSILSQKMQAKTLGGSQTTDQNRSAKMLLYTMPLISVVIGFTLPAGLTVYWIANNVLSIAQEYLLQLQMRRLMKKTEEKEAAEEAVARAAREEARDRNREVQKAIASGGKKNQQKTAKKYKLSRSRRTSSDDGDDDE